MHLAERERPRRFLSRRDFPDVADRVLADSLVLRREAEDAGEHATRMLRRGGARVDAHRGQESVTDANRDLTHLEHAKSRDDVQAQGVGVGSERGWRSTLVAEPLQPDLSHISDPRLW